MPIKVSLKTEQEILSAPLPEATETYTVIPHELIIKQSLLELQSNGFEIQDGFYKSTDEGKIAQGVYYISHPELETDSDLGLMFAWSNSYNKSLRFRCAIGGHIYSNGNGMISGDFARYARKHTGTADVETVMMISEQVKNAKTYYTRLVAVKAKFKDTEVKFQLASEIIGRLFLEKEAINLTQIGIVKRLMRKCDETISAWDLYNYITTALKESHPRKWMEDHEKVHKLFCEYFIPKKPLVIPVQQDLFKADSQVRKTVLFI